MEISFNIPSNLEFEYSKIAQPEDSAARYDSGLVDVFSTPALLALMEATCYRSVMPYLPEGYSTVGIEANIKHLKATPIGKKVSCKCKLQNIENKKLFFTVEAFDEKGKIGEGTHTRYIINMAKFIQNIEQ